MTRARGLSDKVIFAELFPTGERRPRCPKLSCSGRVRRAHLDGNGRRASLYCDTCAWTESRTKGQKPLKAANKPRTCALAGCDVPVRRKGLCNTHSRSWMRCGRPNIATWLEAGGPTPARWAQMQIEVSA